VNESDPSPVTTTQPSAPTPAAYATVARCARPVEEYLRRLSEWGGARPAPRLAPRPVDAFLLHQVAAMLPSPPDVIDLAADATAGASTALWAAHPAVRTVWAPRRAAEANWRERFSDFARDGGGAASAISATRVRLDGSLFVLPGDWAALADAIGRSAPVLALLAGADAAGLLASAAAEFPRCLAVVMGLGPIGGDGALEALLAFRRAHPQFRVAALRELSPFLAHSDLAAVYPADHADATAVLGRIAQAFDGNFGFLNLVQAVASAALGEDTDTGYAASNEERRTSRVSPARPAEQDYARLVSRVRDAVREAVPAGASVLVVSKGDDGLLKLSGHKAAHFPQTDKGEYAGHHPADDAAAVAHLAALRAKGAQYLVLPATSAWWLEHYDGFRRHLEQTATVTVCRPDTCIVFSLAGPRIQNGSVSRPANPAVPYPQLVGRVRAAVVKDVPEGATVAVVSKGDSELVDLPGRRGVHFPQSADGGYAGHHPADSGEAILRLDAARGRGAQYLLFPATASWWLEHYAEFRRHLDEHYRRVRDDETGVLYDLGGRGLRGSGASWRSKAAGMMDLWARRLRGD
jgi:hypothetical protein